MEKTKIADFWLVEFKVKNFSFVEPKDPNKVQIQLDFNPSGEFNANDKKYVLTLKFEAIDENSKSKKAIVKAIVEAKFEFYEEITFEKLPSYFYNNAIAISFPYLRAFISTLTLQAGVKILVLPLLNLTGLSELLKEKTINS